MKVLIVTPYYLPNVGGIEKTVQAHVDLLQRRGHEVHILTTPLKFPDGIVTDAERKRQENYVHYVNVYLRNIYFYRKAIFNYPSESGIVISNVYRQLWRICPDVIHMHNVGASVLNYAVLKAVRQKDIPVIWQPHFHPQTIKFSIVRDLFMNINKRIINRASKILVLNPWEGDLLVHRFRLPELKEKIELLPPGIRGNEIDVPKEGKSSKGANVLFVGRLNEYRKGADIAIQAVERARKISGIDIQLTMIGRGHLELEKSQLEYINLLGEVDENNLMLNYEKTDIFFMPSRYEGFGMPFIEAAAYGVPSIGPNTGGVPYALKDKETGLLCEPENVEAFSNALLQLVVDVDLYRRLSWGAFNYSRNFQWDKIGNRLQTIYYNSSCTCKTL